VHLAGVAQYILADRSDALCHAEAWDYLRDVLLIILGRRFAEENEALALLMAPTICLALTRVADVNSSACKSGSILYRASLSLCSAIPAFFTLDDEPMHRTSVAPGTPKAMGRTLFRHSSAETKLSW
jgi:hypothetical protein